MLAIEVGWSTFPRSIANAVQSHIEDLVVGNVKKMRHFTTQSSEGHQKVLHTCQPRALKAMQGLTRSTVKWAVTKPLESISYDSKHTCSVAAAREGSESFAPEYGHWLSSSLGVAMTVEYLGIDLRGSAVFWKPLESICALLTAKWNGLHSITSILGIQKRAHSRHLLKLSACIASK